MSKKQISTFLFSFATFASVAGLQAATPTPDQLAFFESKIRPILVDNCYKCHSHESEKLKGGLSLEYRESLLKGGETGPAIVPGDPEKSLLIKAVRYTDPDLQMPPKDKKLSEIQINDLVTWVRMGAPDPRVPSAAVASKGFGKTAKEHWAFKPITKTTIPEVKETNWIAAPIDAFVLAKLESNGMKPSAPADKR
ncbi:MAG: c-type cytochrome domain-containing protein, partial [Verrucomicrobiota bacterium]